jgi:hypothetical protein
MKKSSRGPGLYSNFGAPSSDLTSDELEIRQRRRRVSINFVENELEKTIVVGGGRRTWIRTAISGLTSFSAPITKERRLQK